MTERKPQGLSFTSWIDQQVADAERRGVFDDLPGAGKPLAVRPAGGGDFGQAWIRDYARREGVAPEEFLPTPLRLRREIERLGESVSGFRTEAEVREAAAELNRQIAEWRRIPLGPPVHVRLVNADDLVRQWRATRSPASRAPSGPPEASQGADAADTPLDQQRARRRRWWRRPR